MLPAKPSLSKAKPLMLPIAQLPPRVHMHSVMPLPLFIISNARKSRECMELGTIRESASCPRDLVLTREYQCKAVMAITEGLVTFYTGCISMCT